jgi:hypothetical protein
MKSTLKLSLLLGTAVAAMNLTAFAGPGPGGGTWPPKYAKQVKTKAEAEACCLPKEKVALACKDCKTVNEKDGEKDKKGILSWFAPDDKHDCSGCGGKITLKTTGGGKGPTVSEYTHTCSKCGDKSAFTCATHKG